MHLFVLLTLLAALCVPAPARASEDAPGPIGKFVPRVRAADARTKAALQEGLERSASFRAIVDRINRLDVIVYLETQPLLRGRLAGRMTWVTKTADYRYLRVALNPDLPFARLVASLAHELQHVLEVGEAPSIVDNRTLSNYYRGAGFERHASSEAWDTEAAQRTGEIVRRELADAHDGDTGVQATPARRIDGRN